MKIVETIQESGFAESLAAALLHSLWQGAVIGLAVLLIIVFAKKLSSKAKYTISYLGLLTILALFLVSFATSFNQKAEEKTSKQAIAANTANLYPGIKESNKKASEVSLKPVSPSLIRPSKSHIEKMTSNRTLSIAIAFAWLAGVVFFILKFSGEFLYINRLKRSLRISCNSDKLEEIAKKLSEKIGVSSPVKIIQSARFKVPSVIGFLKPLIILPTGLVNGLTTEQVEAVIMHELAHIKRKDYLMNIIQKLTEIIMFYHPVVWLLSSYIRDEREKCCDDMVINSMKNKEEYACALGCVQIFATTKMSGFALQFSGNKNKILNRMKRIIEKPYQRTKRFDGIFASLFIVIGIAAIVFSTNSFSSNENIAKEDLFKEDDTVVIKRKKLVNLVYSDTIDKKLKEINVTMRNDTIEKLYIDGKKVKEKDFPNYEKMISKHIESVEHEDEEVIIKKHESKEKKKEVQVIVGNTRYDRQVNLEEFQLRMSDLSREISDKVKNLEIEETFDEDFVQKMEKFGMEVGKMGAEIGLKIAESFANIQWDTLGIEIDEEDLEEMRRDLQEARKEFETEFKEIERERKTAQENKIEAERQRIIAQEKEKEAYMQQKIAVEQQREAVSTQESLKKEIETLKKELEKIKRELEEEKKKEN